jgi:hypothetical protein
MTMIDLSTRAVTFAAQGALGVRSFARGARAAAIAG